MSDRTTTPQQVQVHTTTSHRYEGGVTNLTKHYEEGVGAGGVGDDIMSLFSSSKGGGGGPSASQILAVSIGVPIGEMLLFLAGISFVGSRIGRAIIMPFFILFSPVLVPTTLTIGLAVAGILASDGCGVMGLMSLSWMMKYMRQDMAKHRMVDVVDYVRKKTKDMGQKTKEVGQDIQTKAHEAKRTT